MNREAIVVAFFSFATTVGSLVGYRVLTECAHPAVLGEYYLWMNVAMWLAAPAAGGYMYVFRNWPVAKCSGHALWFARRIGVTSVAIAALIGALLACGRMLSVGPPSWSLAGAIWLAASSQAAAQLVEPIQMAERRRVIAGALSLAGTPLRMLMVAAAAALGGTATGLMGMQAAHSALLVCASWALFAVTRRFAAPWQAQHAPPQDLRAGNCLRFCGPYLVTAYVTQVCASAERWGIASAGGTAATALFVTTIGIASNGMNAIGNAVLSYYQPLVAEAAERDREKPLAAAGAVLRRVVLVSCALAGSSLLVAGVCGRAVIGVLLAPTYWEAAQLFVWAVAGAGAFVVGQALTMYHYAARSSLWPNAIKLGYQVMYTLALIAAAMARAPLWVFVLLYCASCCLFAVGMGVSVGLLGRAERQNRCADVEEIPAI